MSNQLQAATTAPAIQLGMEGDLGTVERGKLADLVILEANPLEDIAAVAQIAAVVTKGSRLDRLALNALLVRARDW